MTTRMAIAKREADIQPPLLVPTVPERVVVLTMGLLERGYHSTGGERVRAVALDHWETALGPPSIVEFFLTFLIRQSFAPSPRASG